MSNSSDERIYNATTRMITALEQLERNLQAVSVGHDRDIQQNQQLISLQRENAALLDEQEKLHEKIVALQKQYEELQSVTSTVYGKLDSSIERLSHILEKS